ncbi:MAG: hypothetical protein J0M18_13040 [Ignavibacteria bacterium]|nr:hypothetical protein [Ignavibacteria bacterium]
MKNKEYLNIVFNKLYLLLKSYDLAAKDLHLVNNTFKFILNSDNILRDLFVLSSVNKLDAFVNYVLFILKKVDEEKINYNNLSYNIDTDSKFLEKEIINYFSVEPKKITEKEIKKVETSKPLSKEIEVVDEYIDETIADFYNNTDDDTDNIITDENFISKRNNLELVEVERNDEDLNAVFNLPETNSIEESLVENEIAEAIPDSYSNESDINDFSSYDENIINEAEFKSEAEKFNEETVAADYDVNTISEEKETPVQSDNSYWDAVEEELLDEEIEEKTTEIYEEETEEITEDKPVIPEIPVTIDEPVINSEEKTEITAEEKLREELNGSETEDVIEENKPGAKEIILEKIETVQEEMLFDAPELNENEFKESITSPEEQKNEHEKEIEKETTEEIEEEKLIEESVVRENKLIAAASKEEEIKENKKEIGDYFEEKVSEEKTEDKIKEQKEENIEQANEEFIQYENYVLRTNDELKFDFERMMEFAKRLNKNYDERNLIIKDVIDKTSFLENCSRELSLEVITNIYETFKLSFEKISDGKYDLSEETLTIFIESLSLVESLLKGDDYLAYDTLIKSLDKLRKSLLKEKKQKVQAEQKQSDEKSAESLLSNLYPDEHKLFIANNIRRKISDIEKIFNSLNDIDSNYVQIEALNILISNLNNFKELVGYANTIQLASLAKVAEGGYILIKYLQNYRKDPTEEIWKETFKYIIYVMRLLIINKPVEDLDLFISYLNEPIKIYLSKENK